MPRSQKVNKKYKGGPGRKHKTLENIINSELGDISIGENINISVRLDVTPSSSTSTKHVAGSSRRKLFDTTNNSDVHSKCDNEQMCHGNHIINVELLSTVLNNFVKCKNCSEENTIRLCEDYKHRKGLAAKLVLKCTNCDKEHEFYTSAQTRHGFECNIRFVYAMRSIGKGYESGKNFCAVMNLPRPPTKFTKFNAILNNSIKECAEISMQDAVKEAVLENEGSTDLTVALDGSWQKRGHTSANGIVSATSIDTGKIIDVEPLTKYCQKCANMKNCEEKLNQHKDSGECKSNYIGVSGGMEASGAVTIFNRSLEKYGVRYDKYLGDGDSKGFKKVVESKPYGDMEIEKLECIGHVQKRMGSQLRRLRKEYKGKKLEDGRLISGHGRLTEKEIDNIQTYYGMAIRRNTDSVKNMQQDIWAIFLHKLSTDDKPQHFLCPKGTSSWCKYNRAIETKEAYHHKHSLPVPVVEAMRPVFRNLTNPDLLRKCLHGKTQNLNESFNSVVWNRVPKTVFVGYDTLCMGLYDAVLTYNEGCIGRAKVLQKLGIDPGKNMQKICREIDEERVKKSDQQTEMVIKNSRILNRNKKRAREDEEDDPDDPEYGPGMH